MSELAASLGVLLTAAKVSIPFDKEVRDSLATLPRPSTLVAILSTSSSASRQYANFLSAQCGNIGVKFILKEIGAGGKHNDIQGTQALGEGEGVEEAIVSANEDDGCDGILVFYPIFGGRQDHYLQQLVSPLKDVEGLHYRWHYNMYHNIRFVSPSALTSTSITFPNTPSPTQPTDAPPPGTLKSILPCTPLAIIKCLEHAGVYNSLLKYGDRAFGKTVTVINRSEVVGRPLAALLANDGARVFSIDIESIQEYTKRPIPTTSSGNENKSRPYHPHHVVRPCTFTLEQCLALSDVVVSAVPSLQYKVSTEALKDGCVAVNVAGEKNFEDTVREKAAIYIPAVGKVTILMLLRNLVRLIKYQEVLKSSTEVAA